MSWQALNWCATLHRVKGPRRALLWAMTNRHNAKTGFVAMGLTGLANESGLSRSAAHRQLKVLEHDGLVKCLIPASGPKPAAYIFPALASHLEGTQDPVDNSVEAEASVPEVAGLSELPSHSQETASHLGGTPYRNARAPKSNQRTNQQPAAAPTVAADPTADAVGGHSPGRNGKVPLSAETTAAIAQLRADTAAKRIADQQAERARLKRLHGPPASEPERQGRDPPARTTTA